MTLGLVTDEDTMDEVSRITRLETRIVAHEESCKTFRQISYAIAGLMAAAVGSMFTQLMLVTGNQAGVMHSQDEASRRMTELSQANIVGENRLGSEIAELRSMVINAHK